MLIAAEVTVQAMAVIVQAVPIGTNLGLIRILWVMVNGSFLQSRGAVFSALHLSGFNVQEIRRYGGLCVVNRSWEKRSFVASF